MKRKREGKAEEKIGQSQDYIPNIHNKLLDLYVGGELQHSRVLGCEMSDGFVTADDPWARITPETPANVAGIFTTGVEGCKVLIISSPNNSHISMQHSSELNDEEIEDEVTKIKTEAGCEKVIFRIAFNHTGIFNSAVDDHLDEIAEEQEISKDGLSLEEIEEAEEEVEKEIDDTMDDLNKLIKENNNLTGPTIEMQEHGAMMVDRNGKINLFKGEEPIYVFHQEQKDHKEQKDQEGEDHETLPSEKITGRKKAKKLDSGDKNQGVGAGK